MANKILAVSFGQLTSFEAGLGEFARCLGQGLVERASSFRRRGFDLFFHMEQRLHGAFGSEVSYLPFEPRHRFLPWRLPGCVLWHSSFQHNITRPPAGVGQRILTVHDLNYRHVRRGPGPWRAEILTRLAISRSTALATISRYVEDDVRAHTRWRGSIRTIYNGATNLSHAPQQPVPSLIGRSFFFHVSRMARSKNVGAIVELARSWPEQRFVLAGPAWGDSKRLHDELAGTLPNLQVMLGISDAEKGWLLQHCKAFLFPSWTEGFGLPPIEAMHFGTPVFLSDRTSLPEVGGEQAGYFSDFSASAMRSVIERELPRLEASREATRRRAQGFAWERCIAEYIALYATLLPGALDGMAAELPASADQRQVN